MSDARDLYQENVGPMTFNRRGRENTSLITSLSSYSSPYFQKTTLNFRRIGQRETEQNTVPVPKGAKSTSHTSKNNQKLACK